MATAPEGRRINPIFFVLVPLLVVALIAFAIVTFTGGGGEQEPIAVPSPAAGVPRPVATTPSPTPESTEVFEIFEGRDPFRALVFEGGGATPAPGTTPVPGATAAPSTPAPGTATARPAATPVPPRSGVQVELLSVAPDGKTATVRVGSTVHNNAKPGDTLSSGVVLDSIEGKCARFHRGADGFLLCEGEMVLK